MPIKEEIAAYAEEIGEIRRDIHAHPETAFEEFRTADIVADKLTEYGIEIHRGLAKTGVVGTLKVGS
ncbi:MAG: amidohydrolase, partial [Rhodospirillaceae bacterium]|nr:amidohydrolase [Rhodospirillaceae bacterium]